MTFQLGNQINKGRTPWNKDIQYTKEMRDKMSGKNHPQYGKHRSEKTKEKIRNSDYHKNLKGRRSPTLGKHWKLSEEVLKRSKFILNLGEWAQKESKVHPKGKQSFMFGRRGKNHPAWKNGTSKAYKTGYYSIEYKEWRKIVFERDSYICQDCGVRSGNGEKIHLEAHHIKSFTFYPKLRFDVNNGLTLCKECHSLTRKANKRKGGTK